MLYPPVFLRIGVDPAFFFKTGGTTKRFRFFAGPGEFPQAVENSGGALRAQTD